MHRRPKWPTTFTNILCPRYDSISVMAIKFSLVYRMKSRDVILDHTWRKSLPSTPLRQLWALKAKKLRSIDCPYIQFAVVLLLPASLLALPSLTNRMSHNKFDFLARISGSICRLFNACRFSMVCLPTPIGCLVPISVVKKEIDPSLYTRLRDVKNSLP